MCQLDELWIKKTPDMPGWSGDSGYAKPLQRLYQEFDMGQQNIQEALFRMRARVEAEMDNLLSARTKSLNKMRSPAKEDSPTEKNSPAEKDEGPSVEEVEM